MPHPNIDDFTEVLKKREVELTKAHEKISAEIESLLDKRIMMVGAIKELKLLQKKIGGDGKNED